MSAPAELTDLELSRIHAEARLGPEGEDPTPGQVLAMVAELRRRRAAERGHVAVEARIADWLMRTAVEVERGDEPWPGSRAAELRRRAREIRTGAWRANESNEAGKPREKEHR